MALTTVPASLSATALTLTTAAQPNITSVGTLTGLTVSGNIAGTLTTAAQTNITSVGTLTGLTLTGATSIATSSTPLSLDRTGGATAALELKIGGSVKGYLGASGSNILSIFNSSAAEKVSVDGSGNATFAGTIAGTLATAAQPNITSVGSLTHVQVLNGGGSVGGTTPRIYSSASATLDISTNSARRLTIDGSGNVSVLTSGVALNAPVLQVTNANVATYTGTTPAIHSPASATMAFSMGGAERMRINSSGNVGIGGAPDSDAGLHLKGDGKRILIDSTDYNLVSLGKRGSSGSALDDGYFRMKSAGTNTVVLDTAGVSYFNGGNVGIGTTSPASATGYTVLTLNNATNGGNLQFHHNGTYKGVIYNSSSQFRIESGASTPIVFADPNGETMRIDSSGNVGIGIAPTFTPGGSRRLLQITNGANGANISMGNNSNESENPRIFSDADNLGFATATTGGGIFQFYTAGSEKLRIYSDGKVDIKNSGTDKIVRFINTGSGAQGVTIGTTTSNSAGVGLHVGHTGTKAFLHPYNYGGGAYQQMEIACSDFVLKVNGSASGMSMNASAVATFYGDIKINDANDRLLQNGVAREAKGGYIQGNQTVSYTINHSNQSSFHIRCGFNHYGLVGYGCHLDQIFANGSGGITSLTALINHTTGAGGSWSVARVDTDNVTITKNAGTYAGGGYYYIIVEGANL